MNIKIPDIKSIGQRYLNGAPKKRIAKELGVEIKCVRRVVDGITEKGITFDMLHNLENYELYQILYPERAVTDVSIAEVIEAVKDNNYTELKQVYNDLYNDKISYQGLWSMYNRYCSEHNWYNIAKGELPADTGKIGWSSPVVLKNEQRVYVLVGRLDYSGRTAFSIQKDTKDTSFVSGLMKILNAWGGAPRLLCCVNLDIHPSHGGAKRIRLTDNFHLFQSRCHFKIQPVDSEVFINKVMAELGESSFLDIDGLEKVLTNIASRRGDFEKYERHEKARLASFDKNYEVCELKTVNVGFDGFISYDGGFYSVPWKYIGRKLKVKPEPLKIVILTPEEIIELRRLNFKSEGYYRVVEDYIPPEEKISWNRTRLINYAGSIDSALCDFITESIDSAEYPITTYRKMSGILALCNKYDHSIIGSTIKQMKRRGEYISFKSLKAKLDAISNADYVLV